MKLKKLVFGMLLAGSIILSVSLWIIGLYFFLFISLFIVWFFGMLFFDNEKEKKEIKHSPEK